MVDLNFLINDEKEAIEGYEKFLSESPHSKLTIKEIKKIILQEQHHIRILNKLKKQRII